MANERIQINFHDVYWGQLAPAQAARTSFTPGKPNARPDELAWPIDYRPPTSNPDLDENGPADMERVRILFLDRNIICDQCLTAVPPAVACGRPTQENDGRKERTCGYDWPSDA